MKQNKTHRLQAIDRSRLLAKGLIAVSLSLLGVTLSVQAGQGPQPSICQRACWGARNSSCSSMSSLTRAIIHHTAGAGDWTTDYETGKAKVRGVQNLHMDGNGWCDIAYHFLVNAGGHIYEGRKNSMTGLPQGAHDGCNSSSFGFNVLGYYHPPYNHSFTSAARGSLEAVIAWRMPSSWSATGSGTYCGNSVGTLDGHYKVKATACPGDGIIPSIASIRTGVMNLKNGTPPPVFKSGPDVASWGSGRLDVFEQGADNALWHRAYDGVWGAWESLGGNITSGPSAVSWGPNRIDVFARGTDNAIHTISWNGTAWTGWASLGGVSSGGPDVSSWGANRLDLFIRGTDNLLYTKFWTGSAWSNWASLAGATITSDPGAVSWGPNRIDVFARGGDNAIWSRNWDGSVWNTWYSIGGH